MSCPLIRFVYRHGGLTNVIIIDMGNVVIATEKILLTLIRS